LSDPSPGLLGKTVLGIRVWATYAYVRVAERRRPLPEVTRRLGRPAARRRRRHPPERLSHAVDRCLWPIGPPPRCLHTSLVLYRLLRAQGDEPELLVGLEGDPSSPAAHAWVELGGVDVGPSPGRSGYVPLGRFGA
jgi:Transglutaminase-like superfamily